MPPMLTTFFIALVITIFTVHFNSWMTPLSKHQWYVDLWEKDNILAGFRMSSLLAGIGMVVFAYITDMRDWRGYGKYVWQPFCVGIAVSVLIWSSFINRPLLCVGLSVIMTVVATLTVRNRVFKATPKKYLAYGECLAYSLLAVIMIVCWLWWYTDGGDSFLDGVQDWEDGQVVRVFAPVVTAAAYLLVAWFAWIRSRWHSSSLAQSNNFTLGPEFETAMIILFSLMGFVYLAVWIGVGDNKVSNFVLQVSVVTLLCICVYIMHWIGVKRLTKAAEASDTLSTTLNVLSSDWMKAVVLIFLGWILPFFIVVEFVHQVIRNRLQSMGLLWMDRERRNATLGGEELEELENLQGGWITVEAGRRLQQIREWDATSIFTKSIWLGLIVFIIQVAVQKALVLFLAWFNESMVPWPLWATMLLLFIVEMALFLFPPVAGVALYTLAGLVLIPKFMLIRPLGSPLNRWIWGVGVTSFFCLVMKLLAAYIEQKGFGGHYKHNIYVKKFIGTHTHFMKAVRYILSEPGMILAKISILVGGPDWPTSVTTGILDLPALPMLIGTLPVIFIIVPTILSTGFMVCPTGVFEAGICGAASSSLLLFAAVLQQTVFFLALYYTKVLIDHMRAEGLLTDDWMRDPQEDEILVLVKRDEKEAEFTKEATKWEKIPGRVKAALVIGTFLSMAIFAINFLGRPYRAFGMTDSIGEKLGGNPLRIVRTSGWVQIACTFAAVVCLQVYQRWVAATVPNFEEADEESSGDAGHKQAGLDETFDKLEGDVELPCFQLAAVDAKYAIPDKDRPPESSEPPLSSAPSPAMGDEVVKEKTAKAHTMWERSRVLSEASEEKLRQAEDDTRQAELAQTSYEGAHMGAVTGQALASATAPLLP